MHRIHPDELDYLLKFYANIIILFIPFIQFILSNCCYSNYVFFLIGFKQSLGKDSHHNQNAFSI